MSDLLGFTQGFAAAILALGAATKVVARVDLEPFLVATGLPGPVAGAIAPAVVPIEAVLAVLLAAGIAVKGVTAAGLLLSLGFVAAQLKTLRRADQGCRCFGHLDSDDKASALAIAGLLAGSLLLAAAAVASGAESNGNVVRTFGAITGLGSVLSMALIAQVVRFQRERPRIVGG